jgi:hypothetical protein
MHLLEPRFSASRVRVLMEEYVLGRAYLEVIEQRAVDIEVGHFRTPVVHLDVDVGVLVF